MSGRPEHQAPPEIVSCIHFSSNKFEINSSFISSFTMKKKQGNTQESMICSLYTNK